MSDSILIPFWIVQQGEHWPLRFGVTAYSLADALHLLTRSGYTPPEDTSSLQVTERVRVSDLDQSHVVPNMGPMVVRGIWYPSRKVGV
jgi:hypothetical protein